MVLITLSKDLSCLYVNIGAPVGLEPTLEGFSKLESAYRPNVLAAAFPAIVGLTAI